MAEERRRILFLVPSLEGGGAERVFVTILRHLSRDKLELHLGLLQATGPYLKDVPADVQRHVLNVARVRYAVPAILRLIWELRPQAVISTPIHLNLLAACSKPLWPSRIRLFVRESTVVSHFLEEEMKQPALWKYLYRSYRLADSVICLCDAMSRDLSETIGLPLEKIVQIYNPIDSGRLLDLAEGAKNPYKTSGPNLIAAGRLANEKGFDLLLEAMALVSRSWPNAHLTILGEGLLRGALERQRDALGLGQRVSLVGFQENPFPYYRWADLFVSTSKYEGLPNAMLEAIALGIPALAVDCFGGVREVVELFPELAFLCERCPSALAKAILDFAVRNQSQKLCVDAVRFRFRSKFDVKTVVEKYQTLFESC